MPTALAPRPAASHVYQVDADRRFEIQHVVTTRLHSFLVEKGPEAWLWCFRCERAFQFRDARGGTFGTSCAYPDCGGEALDFWSWEAFCSFVGRASIVPDHGSRYTLAG